MDEITWRKRYLTYTLIGFCVGAVLFSLLAFAIASDPSLEGLGTPAAFIALAGAYFFFSLYSGVLFTARLLSRMSSHAQTVMAVCFFVPLYLAMLGMVYAIPYGIYNLVRLRTLRASSSTT